MNKQLIASLSILAIVISINTRVVSANSLDLDIQSHLKNQLSIANKKTEELKKVIDHIGTIISNCKPMSQQELNELLN